MAAIDSELKVTFTATPLKHKELHGDITEIVKKGLRSGIGHSRKKWQDFLSTKLGEYAEFDKRQIDKSARLIEAISLDIITSYLNDINKGRLRYIPAFLPTQSDKNLLPVLNKDSCDGLLFEAKGRQPNPVFIEQKSTMRNPEDSSIGDINDYFEDWINNLLTNVKGDRLFWIFNIMPYSDEATESRAPFDVDKAVDLIHSKKAGIYAGAVCFYTHPDASTLEVTCIPIREKAKSIHKDHREVKRVRFSL